MSNIFDPDSVVWTPSSFKLDQSDISGLVPGTEDLSKANELARLHNLANMIQQYDKLSRSSGTEKWFVPGTPFGIEACPKHKAFFDAGLVYNERTFMAGNRVGKSISGAYEAACHATG